MADKKFRKENFSQIHLTPLHRMQSICSIVSISKKKYFPPHQSLGEF